MLDNGPSTEVPFFFLRSWLSKMTSDFTHNTWSSKNFPLSFFPSFYLWALSIVPVWGTRKDFTATLRALTLLSRRQQRVLKGPFQFFVDLRSQGSNCVLESHTYIHNGILLSHKKEWNLAISNDMDGAIGYAKQNKRKTNTMISLICGI